MEDVHSAGIKPYEKCLPNVSLTIQEKLNLYLSVLFDIIKVLFWCLFVFAEKLLELLSPRVTKIIIGQLALITGGANGLGSEISLKLAALGCNIIIVDVDIVNAEETVKKIQSFNVKGYAFKVDVSDENAVKKLRIDIERDIGFVDILVNNAGLMPLLSIREGEPADVRKIVDVNVLANYWMVREFIGGMIERRRGHIIGISSLSALHPMPGAAIYSSTKFAVAGFMRAFSEEIRQEGHGDYIRFTCVYPYFISTRKDLTEAINLRFPAITVKYAAKSVVDGIIRNRRRIVIPQYNLILLQLLNHLPHKVMDLVRDYVLMEKETRMFKV